MPEHEERLTESNSNVNTISTELPGRPFSITMEVPLFLTMLGLSLSATALSNIILFRSCVHSLNHTKEECHIFLVPDRNNGTQKLEEEVQKYTAFVHMVKLVLESVVPAILSMFLGVWSDTHGRKPLIVWPLFGLVVSSMLMVVFSMMDELGPWWYILTIVPFTVCGGIRIYLTGICCYITDITSSGSRSFRMTLLEAVISVGSVAGSLLSAYLLRAVGNVYLLLIVCTLYVIGYVFTNVYLRESLVGAIEGGITTVMDLLLIKEMFRECFKKRPNHLRAQLLLLTIANSLTIFVLYGLSGLEYMYAREKFQWSLKDFNMFSAISTTISFVGALFGVAVIQKIIPISDLWFSIISFLSDAAEYLIKAFAVAGWYMYLGTSISVFGSLSSPLIRSMITKILPIEDIAKVFALMASLEGLCPLVSPILYNTLYEYTITIFPGAILLLTGLINVGCAAMLGFVAYLRYKASVPSYQPVPSES